MNAPRVDQPGRSRVESPARGPESSRGEGRVERNRQAEPQPPRPDRPQSTEREQDRAASPPRPGQGRGAESGRNAERERSDQRRSEEGRQRERERAGERLPGAERERAAREQKQMDQRKAAEERQRQEGLRPQNRQATGHAKAGDRVSQGREDLRVARERLRPDERQRLRTAFDYQGARVSNARFALRVGEHVPRQVRIFPIPRELVTFFPYYRDYAYVVVNDEICIVDPRTYEIVDVIDEQYYRSGPRQEVARLSLSPQQIAFVRDSIPRDFPEADVRLRLALGAEIPPDVELYEFPRIVEDRVPWLREYRFLVAEDQIVIVDPRDGSIAFFVERG
jgi:hypothetical protein